MLEVADVISKSRSSQKGVNKYISSFFRLGFKFTLRAIIYLPARKSFIRRLKKQYSNGIFNFEMEQSLFLDLVAEALKSAAFEVAAEGNFLVKSGPYKGLVIPDYEVWPDKNSIAKIFGIYESQVIEALISLPADITTIINIGAADGFHTIGLIRSGKFQRGICFELMSTARQMIRELSEINGVENQIEVYGRAGDDFLQMIEVSDISTCVVLIDIEGGEISLLSKENLEKLSDCFILIEVHEFVFGRLERESLLKAIKIHHSVKVLKSATAPAYIDSISQLPENWSHLLISEGRPNSMEWWLCTPLKRN
jgi:hypothetical protein